MIKYNDIHLGTFINRPNRFLAHVEIDGAVETVHVKNTGRCRELLTPGALVSVQHFSSSARKTAWDLIAVKKPGLGWVNIDSQVPNKVVGEWLRSKCSPFANADLIKPEYRHGNSRLDFYLEQGERRILMEVKGCTLEIDRRGYFPDAPTDRGAKHLGELAQAVSAGYETYLVYCIAMPEVPIVLPNEVTDPRYAQAFYNAVNAGVKVLFLSCEVTTDSIEAARFQFL